MWDTRITWKLFLNAVPIFATYNTFFLPVGVHEYERTKLLVSSAPKLNQSSLFLLQYRYAGKLPTYVISHVINTCKKWDIQWSKDQERSRLHDVQKITLINVMRIFLLIIADFCKSELETNSLLCFLSGFFNVFILYK